MTVQIEKVMNGEPVKIYAHQSLKYGWTTITEHEDMTDYVLIGVAEATFNTVDKNEAIQKAADMLDRKIQETYAKAEIEVNRIKDQKAQLLALTHDAKAES